jgi:hypothetical protein
MAILDLAVHPFAYVTIAELCDYWRLSREHVLAHVAAGHFETIELGPGIYRVRASTALEFERQRVVARPEPGRSLVVWPPDRSRVIAASPGGSQKAVSSTPDQQVLGDDQPSERQTAPAPPNDPGAESYGAIR